MKPNFFPIYHFLFTLKTDPVQIEFLNEWMDGRFVSFGIFALGWLFRKKLPVGIYSKTIS